MKKHSISQIDGKFYLNEHQFFNVDKSKLKGYLSQIKFPAIVIDTEFFNHSHDRSNNDFNQLYNDERKDVVTVFQYSFISNLKEITTRDNTKSIKSVSLKRGYNDSKYDFELQYEKMVKSFLSNCIKKRIRTMIVAGGTNDNKIIRDWAAKYHTLFKNKKIDLFKFNSKNQLPELNSFDIYPPLEQSISFSNYDKDGREFYVKNYLKPGQFGEDTIALPGLKKFFDYMKEINEYNFDEEKDVYELSCSALKFYSYKTCSLNEYKELNKDIKLIRQHCYNDVLKILLLIDFLYSFSFLPYKDNKYVNTNSSKSIL
ncbi:hypothetical protein SSABA_v1c05080 [Spiroplasma sabaudiense Ar-1343]|uniref:Uncharacterized protein n=1 Tax=Spiroplasma sabaudiense Ar-1343 TaxID=1276257 RepID=W6AAN3_9MOLU|nr:hypothetical protein [Spiroplasma sabaudiense]AHI53915.1 hypothetical protein SSABA_v1c05080 [Spiroplasma sabaudiense Ar-1343]